MKLATLSHAFTPRANSLGLAFLKEYPIGPVLHARLFSSHWWSISLTKRKKRALRRVLLAPEMDSHALKRLTRRRFLRGSNENVSNSLSAPHNSVYAVTYVGTKTWEYLDSSRRQGKKWHKSPNWMNWCWVKAILLENNSAIGTRSGKRIRRKPRD